MYFSLLSFSLIKINLIEEQFNSSEPKKYHSSPLKNNTRIFFSFLCVIYKRATVLKKMSKKVVDSIVILRSLWKSWLETTEMGSNGGQGVTAGRYTISSTGTNDDDVIQRTYCAFSFLRTARPHTHTHTQSRYKLFFYFFFEPRRFQISGTNVAARL